jgi:hypothetical protein
MEYSTENWDKLVSLFNSVYDLILGFLGQFTMFELIVLGLLIYIVYMVASNFMITERRLKGVIHTNFEYIEQINANVIDIKNSLDSLAGHEDMTQLQMEVDDLKSMLEQALDQTKVKLGIEGEA